GELSRDLLHERRVDARRFEPASVVAEVFAGCRHQKRPLAQQGEGVGDVWPAAAAPLLHRVDEKADTQSIQMFRQDVLGELPGERHQVVEGDGAGHDDFHFIYFPIIGASSVLVCSGTNCGWVMMAVASAVAHGQVLGPSIRPTASAIASCAVFAFCKRFATIRSTVTESWSGCQQS